MNHNGYLPLVDACDLGRHSKQRRCGKALGIRRDSPSSANKATLPTATSQNEAARVAQKARCSSGRSTKALMISCAITVKTGHQSIRKRSLLRVADQVFETDGGRNRPISGVVGSPRFSYGQRTQYLLNACSHQE